MLGEAEARLATLEGLVREVCNGGVLARLD